MVKRGREDHRRENATDGPREELVCKPGRGARREGYETGHPTWFGPNRAKPCCSKYRRSPRAARPRELAMEQFVEEIRASTRPCSAHRPGLA